jgi:hypothetical protein
MELMSSGYADVNGIKVLIHGGLTTIGEMQGVAAAAGEYAAQLKWHS